MTSKVTTKVTYESYRSIEPIYTGGEVSANATGSLLATSVDGDIQVVEVRTGRPVLRIDGDGESLTSLALSPTASHLVTCSRSLSMRIFTLSTDGGSIKANLLRTLKPHTSPVISSVIDSTGSLLITGGADGVAKVWDIKGGYCSHTFHGHGGLVTALEIFEINNHGLRRSPSHGKKRKSRDGEDTAMVSAGNSITIFLATGGEDGKIKIWDLNLRKNVATLDSHVSVVRSIKYSAKQKSLLSVSRDKTIVIWNTHHWQPQRIIPALEVLESGGFVRNSKFCYGGGENGRLRIWNVETGKETTEGQQPGLETETIVAIVQVMAEDALMTIHQDQTMIIRSCAPLEGLDSDTTAPLPILRRISGNHDEVIDMACIGPDRSQLALATNTESVKIISIGSNEGDESAAMFGTDIALLEGHQDIIICLDVDWSGHWLATGAKDNTARLWRLDPANASYECVASLAGHAESLGAVALPRTPPNSPAAAKDPLNHPPPYLITGSQDKTIKKWDTSKLKLSKKTREPQSIAKAVFTRVAHEKDINALDISPIAPLFASASQDRTIKIWSLEDGSTAGILRGHKRGVWSVRFSPAGVSPLSLAEGGSSSARGLLVSGSGDRTVKIWSLSTYACLLTFEGHSNSVLKVIWLPPPGSDQRSDDPENPRHTQAQNQPIVASGSADTLVKLWTPYASPDSDHLLATLDNHTDRVWSLASPTPAVPSNSPKFHSINQHPYTLVSGAADATLTFWSDTTTQTAQATTKAQSLRVEQDQLLQNHIHARNYRDSIILSLRLNHPARLLKILSDVINLPESEKEPNSLTGVHAVDDVLSTLSQEEIYLLLSRVRDWNTNARTAPVAQRVLNVLFKKYPAATWTEMARNRSLGRQIPPQQQGVNENNDDNNTDISTAGPKKRQQAMSMRDLFRALEVYTERHYKRMEELVDESYLIEYTLREMDEVAGTVGVGIGDGVGVDGDVTDMGMSGADEILRGSERAMKVFEMRGDDAGVNGNGNGNESGNENGNGELDVLMES